MRDIKRIRKFCNQLADLWEAHCPDMRFGQLVHNVVNSGELAKTDPFYIEDEEMLQHFKNYFSKQMEEQA